MSDKNKKQKEDTKFLEVVPPLDEWPNLFGVKIFIKPSEEADKPTSFFLSFPEDFPEESENEFIENVKDLFDTIYKSIGGDKLNFTKSQKVDYISTKINPN